MKNKQIIISFILGIILSIGTVYAANINTSNEFSYDNSRSNLISTNIKDSIDELYKMKVTDKVLLDKYKELVGTPTNYIFDGTNKPTTSSKTTPPEGKRVYLALYEPGKYGLCIKREDVEHCFVFGNAKEESLYMKEVFSDVEGYEGTIEGRIKATIYDAEDFECKINEEYGVLTCFDKTKYEIDNETYNDYCDLYGNESMECSSIVSSKVQI